MLASPRRAALRAATLAAVVLTAPACLAAVAQATPRHHHHHGRTVTVHSGDTWVVPSTMALRSLTVEPGATITSPAGTSVTLTVNGVETGSVLTQTGGTDTTIAPGTYRGRVVLTVAVANPVAWQALTFPFRQALYVGSAGVDVSRSVLAAVRGGRVTSSAAAGVGIASTGEAFDGVYVKDGAFTLYRPRIRLTGNGRSDVVGYGAAIVGTGTGTRLVVDGADISNTGAVRTGVVADGGSNVVVKNSRIRVRNGALPAGYQETVDLTYMESAPWMLGISGNNRATNLLGVDTKASYLNSSIASEGWGVLSTDSGQDGQLTAIDSTVTNTGKDGYGSYAIGNATERFLGTRFDVATYATINRGGSVLFGDSSRAAVAKLNADLDLGLTARELAKLPVRGTVIDSRRFGVMWHGAGSAAITGGTQVRTRESTFLDKGQAVDIDVDGSQGARLDPANGVLMQVMEDDDPGPQMVDGKLLNTGVYHEPTGEPVKSGAFDVTAEHDDDAVARFSDISLKGDFFNGIRGGGNGGSGPGAVLAGKNLVLHLDDARIAGVISASTTKHPVDTITSAEYEQLGEVSNTAGAAVNNGVIVDLQDGSVWAVTGTSHLTKLVVGADATVRGSHGAAVSMTVDGVPTPIVPGHTYTGAIVVAPS
jgi:hypothetical protein